MTVLASAMSTSILLCKQQLPIDSSDINVKSGVAAIALKDEGLLLYDINKQVGCCYAPLYTPTTTQYAVIASTTGSRCIMCEYRINTRQIPYTLPHIQPFFVCSRAGPVCREASGVASLWMPTTLTPSPPHCVLTPMGACTPFSTAQAPEPTR
jgi:hypothetical protein